MANFMSMIPRTGMKGAVLGVNRALEASLIDLAATFKFLFGGDAYKGAKPVNPSKTDGSTCVPKPCSFIDSRIIRRGELIRSNKDLIHLFHHHFGLGQSTQFRAVTIQTMNYSRSSMLEAQMSNKNVAEAADNQGISQCSENNASMGKHQIGENVSRKDKINFLVRTLLDLDDSKEAVYSALDAWVAWEQNFPIASLKRVLQILEKEQQWHRVVQVIKWMLSKGQGATMGTYAQLIRALDMDHRAEEAHKFWVKNIGTDLHSVSWQLCRLMISIYYRNNRLEDLVKLFKGLEAFDRKPPEKSIVQKVANAYEILGLPEEKERVLEKYSDLFTETRSSKKFRKASSKKMKSGQGKHVTTSDGPNAV